MSDIELLPEEVLPDRPFTDLRHSVLDLQVLRYLITCVFMSLDHALDIPEERPLILYQPDPKHWLLRRVLTAPERLIEPDPLTVVGFFGQRSRVANLAYAQRLDKELLGELATHDGLLSYVSMQLPTGNYANLVLFDSLEAKDRFGASPRHAQALRRLLPDFYLSVRIYNGVLPHGVRRPDTLHLYLVKYYDFCSRPVWRASRALDIGDAA